MNARESAVVHGCTFSAGILGSMEDRRLMQRRRGDCMDAGGSAGAVADIPEGES